MIKQKVAKKKVARKIDSTHPEFRNHNILVDYDKTLNDPDATKLEKNREQDFARNGKLNARKTLIWVLLVRDYLAKKSTES